MIKTMWVVGALVALSAVRLAAQCDLAHQFRQVLQGKAETMTKQAEANDDYRYTFYRREIDKANMGGTTVGQHFQILWEGQHQPGTTPIVIVRATLQHLTHLQNSTSATEENAKLIYALTTAIEEHDKLKPSVGGELNKLIPE